MKKTNNYEILNKKMQKAILDQNNAEIDTKPKQSRNQY